ncbi:hypothetical protein NXZ79_14215 [Lysinibacillus sp. PB211]|uniref:Uncharacterized protein n=1 Tax=Lysinibacillus pinottii TaxID=2973932 RepID=A0ABT2DRX0_9BACI|nr:hypothetical protein [Lysinibacillus sphaericus]MCS1397182.1 hypothetical protein [Lysinibacillus sp. PB211]
MVNGEIITADDAAALIEAIDEEIKQNPLF